MRIEITKQECKWLIDLVQKEKEKAMSANEETPHRVFELRRDNMKDLETKITQALNRQVDKSR